MSCGIVICCSQSDIKKEEELKQKNNELTLDYQKLFAELQYEYANKKHNTSCKLLLSNIHNILSKNQYCSFALIKEEPNRKKIEMLQKNIEQIKIKPKEKVDKEIQTEPITERIIEIPTEIIISKDTSAIQTQTDKSSCNTKYTIHSFPKIYMTEQTNNLVSPKVNKPTVTYLDCIRKLCSCFSPHSDNTNQTENDGKICETERRLVY